MIVNIFGIDRSVNYNSCGGVSAIDNTSRRKMSSLICFLAPTIKGDNMSFHLNSGLIFKIHVLFVLFSHFADLINVY